MSSAEIPAPVVPEIIKLSPSQAAMVAKFLV